MVPTAAKPGKVIIAYRINPKQYKATWSLRTAVRKWVGFHAKIKVIDLKATEEYESALQLREAVLEDEIPIFIHESAAPRYHHLVKSHHIKRLEKGGVAKNLIWCYRIQKNGNILIYEAGQRPQPDITKDIARAKELSEELSSCPITTIIPPLNTRRNPICNEPFPLEQDSLRP